MSEKIKYEGVIGYVSEKPYQNVTLYSFTIKGIDGFFRCGQKKPKEKVGSYISFLAETDQKGNKNVDMESINGSVRQPAPPQNKDVPEGHQSSQPVKAYADAQAEKELRKQAWEQQKQRSIHYQSAHKDAIELAKFIVEKDFIKLPTAYTSKYSALMALVDDLTNKFFADYELDHSFKEAVAAEIADDLDTSAGGTSVDNEE